MATLYTSYDSNTRKTWLLFACFFAVVVAIGWFVSYYYNDPLILIFAVVFSVVTNIVSYWKSDSIALRLAGASPVKKEEYPDLYTMVENLAITAGMQAPRVYVIEDTSPNAFATGRDEAHAAIAVTTGLLALLDKSELEGVIAHELSHIRNRDTLVATVSIILVGFVALLSDYFVRFSLYRDSDSNRATGVLVIIGILLTILSPIIATLMQLAISRKREFLADASGALLTRYPEGLAQALKKISQHNQPLQRANNATAHLYIANPFGAKGRRGIHRLFSTHPPVEERINALLRT